MKTIESLVLKESSALFVATGPSNKFVDLWRPHFRSVAVHQQALLSVPGQIDFATFLDWNTAVLCKDHFHRVSKFMCMVPLSGNHTGAPQNDTRELKDVGIPEENAYTWDRHFYSCSRDADFHIIEKYERPWAAWGSAVTIHLLAMMGYKWIFCLGHSDCLGIVPDVYKPLRKACQFAADAVAIRFGCRVCFWHPESTPGNWRTHEDRGFI